MKGTLRKGAGGRGCAGRGKAIGGDVAWNNGQIYNYMYIADENT